MEAEKTRKPMGLPGKIAMGYIAVLSVVLLVVNVLDRSGYALIESYLNLLGVLLLLFSLVVIAGVWGIRKVKARAGKFALGALLALVVMIGGAYALTAVSQYSALLIPSRYAVLTSPAGKQAVILRGVDTGYESEEAAEATKARMDARKAHILETDPSEKDKLESEEDYPVGAFGYYYTVYPRVAGIFYNKNAQVEGKIYQGVNSAAKLNFEWLENGDLRLYLKDAELGDSGEVILKAE